MTALCKADRRMTIQVSIIEDDVQTRGIFADWLRRAADFALVSEYGDAESAITGLAQVRPHVVLTDINLPGLSGVEAVRQLKLLIPETQFVMLTVYEDADHIYDALTAGASGYLLKHTHRDQLLAALRDVHGGGSPMTSNIARKVVQAFQQVRPVSAETPELSAREKEVLDLLARGYLYKEIAESLTISVPTVNTYIRRIYEKLQVRSRSHAVAKYAQFAPRQDGRRGRNEK
jgi:DNA-binding NarL/FixJ family response regulator